MKMKFLAVVTPPPDIYHIIHHMCWLYLLQGLLGYMVYYLLTGRHSTCCDSHIIGQRYQWEYPLVEILLLPQIYHI